MLHPVTTGPRTPELEATLGAHVAGVRFDDLSDEAVNGARRTLLWHLATAFAGSAAPGSAAILRFARAQGTGAEATVMGADGRLPAISAAFANACFGKAHEYEDKYWLDAAGGFAIGFAVAPAALAMAEARGGVSGRDLLAAIAVAVDFQARMVEAIRDPISPDYTGWNSTYTFANWGTAVATARVLGLDGSQVVDTLGLVHAQTAGNFQGQLEGVMGIRMQAGYSTRNGMTAAQLAGLGIGGARQSLSGRFGFYKLYYHDRKVDMDSLAAGLGQVWRGARLGYKGYPCGVVAHPVLDAIRQLRDRAPVDRIRAIRVLGTPTLVIMSRPVDRRQNPENAIDAQFSLPWVVACTLRDGMLRLDHFDDDLVRRPEYLDLTRKVEIDMQEGREAVTVEIELTDGQVLISDPVMFCRGHPDNPVTTPEMEAFLHQAAAMAANPVPADRIDRLIDAIRRLEDLPDARDLTACLVAP